MRNIIKQLKLFLIALPILIVTLALGGNSITIEKTIPEEIQITEMLEFVINVQGRTIEVHLENGVAGTLDPAQFEDIWDNVMNDNQRTILRGFIKQLAALSLNIAPTKITGNFMD